MVGIEGRHRPSRQAAASPATLLLLEGASGALVVQGGSPGLDQPLRLDPLVAPDKLGPARGLMTGLAVSMMVWAAVAVSIWQNLL